MQITCIIPARGGSVRLPRKNILPFNGKPLLYWTIKAWEGSKYFNTPYVSTDDDEIRKVAYESGAYSIARPASLSKGDLASPVPILNHAIDFIEKYKNPINLGWLVLLQPTSPLRLPKDIDECIEACLSGLYDSATSVCDGKENGAVYVTSKWLIKRDRFYGDRLFKYQMPPERSIDIDTLEDFQEAERRMLNGSSGGMQHKLEGHSGSQSDDTSHKRGRQRRTG